MEKDKGCLEKAIEFKINWKWKEELKWKCQQI